MYTFLLNSILSSFMEGMRGTFSVPFIACQECSDIWYTVYSISTKTIKSEHNRKTKGKESRRKCWRFRERWYYYFCLDILVWICQRHLSEVIALSVMSLTHHGTLSRRDYIFGHSIITIRKLLTCILAPNREQLFRTLPQSLLRIFDTKTNKTKTQKTREREINETKQLFAVYMTKKHVEMLRFETKETCFVPFSLLDALSDSSPVELQHSRLSLILKDTLCIFCHPSQTDPLQL